MWLLELIKSFLCNQDELDEARGDIRILQDQIDTLVQERDLFYELPLISPDPDRDVLDGKYVGDLTIEDNINQFEYRISTHVTYIHLIEEDSAWENIAGTIEYGFWAINGYDNAIEYLKILGGIK